MKRLAALLLTILIAGCATPSDRGPLKVKLIAFNDFHGNLESPASTIRAPEGGLVGDTTGRDVAVPAGGVARFATLVRQRLMPASRRGHRLHGLPRQEHG